MPVGRRRPPPPLPTHPISPHPTPPRARAYVGRAKLFFGMVETFRRALPNSGRVEKFSTILLFLPVMRRLEVRASSKVPNCARTVHVRAAASPKCFDPSQVDTLCSLGSESCRAFVEPARRRHTSRHRGGALRASDCHLECEKVQFLINPAEERRSGGVLLRNMRSPRCSSGYQKPYVLKHPAEEAGRQRRTGGDQNGRPCIRK